MDRIDVGLRIDQESARWIVGDIGTANGFENLLRAPDEQAAAFQGHRRASVRRDVIERGRRDSNRYNASSAIAMPIPPPMQSAATP